MQHFLNLISYFDARAAASGDPLLSQLCVYVAQDCTVYKQDVRDLCQKQAEQNRRFTDKEWSKLCYGFHNVLPISFSLCDSLIEFISPVELTT